ncbi:hypothetical protein N7540_009384 [Penicillium herquei]|nr:hypothetical protein N7540_009384 [Penicillium herquei]
MVSLSPSHGPVDSSLPSLVSELRAFLRRSRSQNQRSDAASIASAMTTYDDDDKHVWREFRRDLIKLGFRSSDIRKHAPDLKAHLHDLRHDPDEDMEIDPEDLRRAIPPHLRDPQLTPNPESTRRDTLPETSPPLPVPTESLERNDVDWRENFPREEHYTPRRRESLADDQWSSAATVRERKHAQNPSPASRKEARNAKTSRTQPPRQSQTAEGPRVEAREPKPSKFQSKPQKKGRSSNNTPPRGTPKPDQKAELDPNEIFNQFFAGFPPSNEQNNPQQHPQQPPYTTAEPYYTTYGQNPQQPPQQPPHPADSYFSGNWQNPQQPPQGPQQPYTTPHNPQQYPHQQFPYSHYGPQNTAASDYYRQTQGHFYSNGAQQNYSPQNPFMDGNRTYQTPPPQPSYAQPYPYPQPQPQPQSQQQPQPGSTYTPNDGGAKKADYQLPKTEAITWRALSKEERHPIENIPVLPEGWDWRIDDRNRLFYVDTYAKGKEKRCFWHPPEEEEDDYFDLSGWERVCTVFGRIYWLHKESRIISYRFPIRCEQLSLENGELYVLQNGWKHWREANLSIFKLNDNYVHCQITHEVWEKGLSDEAIAVRGELWWRNDAVREKNLKLSEWRPAEAVLNEIIQFTETAGSLNGTASLIDSDGALRNPQENIPQFDGPEQRGEQEDDWNSCISDPAFSRKRKVPEPSPMTGQAKGAQKTRNFTSNYEKAYVEDEVEENCTTAE